MGKQNPNQQAGRGPAMIDRPGGLSTGTFKSATLVGMAVLIGITGMDLYESREQQASLNEKLTQLDTPVNALRTKIHNSARAPAPQRNDPDPNKGYTVKTHGEPFAG